MLNGSIFKTKYNEIGIDVSTVRIFKHYVRIPFLVLGLIEVILLGLSVYISAYIRFSGKVNFDDIIHLAELYAIVMLISMVALGLYQASMRDGILGVIRRLFVAYILGNIILAVIFYLFPSIVLGRGLLVLSNLISFVLIITLRQFSFKVDPNVFKNRILVLGTGNKALAITQLRRKTDKIGFEIVGYIHLRGTKDDIDSDKIIRLKMPLKDFAVQNDIDEIILAVEDRRKGLPVHELLDCKLSGIAITDVVSFFERETGKIRLDQIHPSWLMLNDGFKNSFLQDLVKRLFDVTVSIMLLLLTWPLMILTILAIKIEDGLKAPVIYRQIRIGENGKPFQVLKFRSMSVDAEKDGKIQWATKSDSRVTRTGRIIRKTRIDELPQIFNVLRGDMSFVGPRPERPEFVVRLSEKIPYYSERHRVKPGITGWAQICYPYGASEKDALEKLQFDLYYVKNQSLFLDFLVLVQTAEVILFGKGAR